MKLIIAEKPELGKAIAAAICNKPISNSDGAINCGEYTVISAFGHLFKLKQPEEYDIKYKKWEKSMLPIYFPNWEIVPAEDKINRVNTIGNLLKTAEMVIHAGDPDDEGQLLIDEILDYFKYRGPVKRLSTNDNNPDFIRNKMNNLQDNDLFKPDGYAARARGVADFIVGINYSRFFTMSNTTNSVLNVGRVQTPTLGLVVSRDLQIENHIKSYYYELFLALGNELSGIKAKYYPNIKNPIIDENGKIADKQLLEKVLCDIKGKTVQATITKKNVKDGRPLPLNQVELQTWCGIKYGYTLDETSRTAQELREQYKAITYNRSSSRYLNEEHYIEAPTVIKNVLNITGISIPALDPTIKSSCFKQVKEPHHAIIPTGTYVDLNRLTEMQKNVYLSIAMFYLAQFMPDAIDQKTTLVATVSNGDTLSTQSYLSKEQGWRTYFREKNNTPSILDNTPPGTYTVPIIDGEIATIETQPPKHYTEISLNKDMTVIAKYVQDPKIKEILIRKDADNEKANGSIGTESTRTSIITNLISKGYLEIKGKQLIASEKGKALYNVLPDEIKLPDMTAKWWAIQEKIKENKATPEDLYTDVLQTVNNILAKPCSVTVGEPRVFTAQQGKIVGNCPCCGCPVTEMPKSYSCSGYKQGCKFVIWKTGTMGVHKILASSNKKITTTMVKTILAKGKVLATNLVSEKTGKPYSAYIVLNKTEKGTFLQLDFNDVPRKKEKK